FGFEVGSRQWIGLALTACGLVLLGITLPTPHGAHSSYGLAAMCGFEAGLFGIGGLLILGPRVGAPAEHHGVMLGAASGVLFGVSDVAIKALTGLVGLHGALGLASPWFVVALAASIVAFYASARGLQDGEAVPVIAITGTAANISCIAGGLRVVAVLRTGGVRRRHGHHRAGRDDRLVPGAREAPPLAALRPYGGLRRRPRSPDHRARRGRPRLRRARQPVPRRPVGAVLREHRTRPRRRRAGRRRPGARAGLLHELVLRAPARDRARRARGLARSRRPQPR